MRPIHALYPHLTAALGAALLFSCSAGEGSGAGGSSATGTGATSSGSGGGGSVGTGGTSVVGGTGATSSASGGGSTVGVGGGTVGTGGGSVSTGGTAVVVGEGDLGPAEFTSGELDGPSTGATITFQDVGGTGWYPSRRDPSSGQCDVVNDGACCMTEHALTSEVLTPWNEELSMTLRGPMAVKQIVAYQPGAGGAWARSAAWDSRGTSEGLAFWGNESENGFTGRIGSVCEVEVAPNIPFPCGPGSLPYCTEGNNKYYGFSGSKMIVILGWNPHAGSGVLDDVACDGAGHGWHDAPWMGLTHGELVRSGRYSGCHCWSKPGNPYAQDGCGQFNVFEAVNDNNQYANFDIFSTNLVSYAGYYGGGPCGVNCDAGPLPATADFLDKSGDGNTAATSGAVVSGPGSAPSSAFVRPDQGYRYFVVLLDEQTSTVQIGLIHPNNIPASVGALLPNFPETITRDTVDAVIGLRLPN